jgi:hypothetical protein
LHFCWGLCPKGDGDEIIVCAAQPEGDHYPIPKPRRDGAGGSWTSAVESLNSYARAVLPNSCAVNGSNGFTGCLQLEPMAFFSKLSILHPPFYPEYFYVSHAA